MDDHNTNLSNSDVSNKNNYSAEYLRMKSKCNFWRTACFLLIVIALTEAIIFYQILNSPHTLNKAPTISATMTKETPSSTLTCTPVSTATPTAKPNKSTSSSSSSYNSTGTKSSKASSSSSLTSNSTKSGEYWCMGKNDTCQNKTTSPYDFYCSSCDKNNNNIEDKYE